MRTAYFSICIAALALTLAGLTHALEGTALSAGRPMAGANVTLWASQGKELAKEVEKVTAGDDGGFKFATETSPDQILYKDNQIRLSNDTY